MFLFKIHTQASDINFVNDKCFPLEGNSTYFVSQIPISK